MTQKSALHLGYVMDKFSVPRDGVRRYLYDIWQPLALLLLITGLLITNILLPASDLYAFEEPIYDFFCNPDGKLEATNAYDSYQSYHQSIFTIDLAYGHNLPFSSAKVIDAAWDAVIGRGGQFVVAAIAYRTLRRSLNLIMETCTVTIPATASLYCRQIQLESVGQLIHIMFWHWGTAHLRWRRAIHIGRLRLCAQLFVCIYVLLFATLVSVMTGYRARLTAYTSYEDDGLGPLFEVNQLVHPRVGLKDGARVGLPNTTMFAHDAIVYPNYVHDTLNLTGTYSISEFLANSRDFREPWGVLVDCE
jgi:hypothetical protein